MTASMQPEREFAVEIDPDESFGAVLSRIAVGLSGMTNPSVSLEFSAKINGRPYRISADMRLEPVQ